MVSFSTAVSLFFKKYANFSGRASRSMYWWVILFMFIIYLICILIMYSFNETFGYLLNAIAGLIFIVPYLALSVRRMHDIGKGGGWIFISLVPLIGGIWYLVLCLTASEPYDNRFGPVPGSNELKY